VLLCLSQWSYVTWRAAAPVPVVVRNMTRCRAWASGRMSWHDALLRLSQWS